MDRLPAAKIESLNADSFPEFISRTDKPVLFDFWAPWCAPCRRLEPVLSALDDRLQGQLALAKINVDMSIDIAKRYNVRGVPTLLLLKDGKEVARFDAGAYTVEELERELAPHLQAHMPRSDQGGQQ